MDVSAKIRALYKCDEKRAFRLLFDTYRHILFLYALRLVREKQGAEDVVQDCFMDFWINRRIETVSGDIGKYLLGAVHRTSMNYIRKNMRLGNLLNKLKNYPVVMLTEIEYEFRPELKRLYEAIALLPEDRRRIFMMIAVEGMKYQAVADSLGISINTVKTQMQRALKSLRDSFGSR